MGSSSPALSNMQFLVLLSAVAMAFASPIPEEGMEAPEAIAYVHDATGDVAVDDSPAALPYVVAAPAKVEVKAAAVAPVTYAAYPHYAGYPYAVAAYHTGCVNNVGSVVPCA